MKIPALLFTALVAFASGARAQSPDCANFGCDLAPQGCGSCHYLWNWCDPSYPFCSSCDSNCRGFASLSPEERSTLKLKHDIRTFNNPASLTEPQQLMKLVGEHLGVIRPEPKQTARVLKLPINHPVIKPRSATACAERGIKISLALR